MADALAIFESYPAEWEWVALILGVVSLVVAGPTLLQMAFGGPKLRVWFNEIPSETGTLLTFTVINHYASRLLRRLGVRREVANFQVLASIQDTAGNRVAGHFLPGNDLEVPAPGSGKPPYAPFIAYTPFPSYSLPAALTPLSFPVVTQGDLNGQFVTWVISDTRLRLVPGNYVLTIDLVESQKPTEIKNEFVVGTDFLKWLDHGDRP